MFALVFAGQAQARSAIADVAAYGAIPDDDKDDTAAIQKALAASLEVEVPPGTYRVSSTLRLRDHLRLSGIGRPTLTMTSANNARMFEFMRVTDAKISGFRIDGNKDVTPTDCLICLHNATENEISDNHFVNLPGKNGGVHLSGSANKNTITRNRFLNSEGTSIGFIGSGVHENEASHNTIKDSGRFGIFVAGGAHDNLLAYNVTKRNRAELIGITYQSHHNRVIGNHAQGTGDNGISVTGNYNTVTGNICYKNHLAGIWVWGSFNTITGNNCTSNNQVRGGHPWAGIGVSSNFGGVGQYNIISGNVTDDDQPKPSQYNGIRITSNAYPLWQSGIKTQAGSYAYEGLNVYRADSNGITGKTPPTHLSGTVSDGGVRWIYVNTFLHKPAPMNNIVSGNIYGRSLYAPVHDLGGWKLNRLQ